MYGLDNIDMSPLRVLTTTWPTSLTCRPRRELLRHWRSTTCRRDQRASFLWQLKKTTSILRVLNFWSIWRLPFNPRRSLNVWWWCHPHRTGWHMDAVAIATITPLRLRASIEGRGTWRSVLREGVLLFFAGWNITISSFKVILCLRFIYLYFCDVCILLCCSLFLVPLTITKPKHEEVCNSCNLCNLRHIEKHLCKESGDEVFSFGGPVGWIRKSGEKLQTLRSVFVAYADFRNVFSGMLRFWFQWI